MKKGKLFTKLGNQFPELNELSAYKFSALTRKELLKIAKVLRKNDIENPIFSNYPQWTSEELAKTLYKYVREL